jgi:hypothetical protein
MKQPFNDVQFWLQSAQCGNIPQSIIDIARNTIHINGYINTPNQLEQSEQLNKLNKLNKLNNRNTPNTSNTSNTPNTPNILNKYCNKTTWNGKRPYLGALEEYTKYLSNLLNDMKNKLDTHKSFSYIESKINFDEKLCIITDSGELRTYSWDSVHYGPIIPPTDKDLLNLKDLQSYRKAKQRDTPWLRLGYTEHPFEKFKRQFKNQGYKLTDIYNEKNRQSRIKLAKLPKV